MEHVLKLRQFGNSVGFTIPKPIRDKMGLGINESLNYSFDGKRLIIESSVGPNIDDLVGKMSKENSHAETLTGSRVGNEF